MIRVLAGGGYSSECMSSTSACVTMSADNILGRYILAGNNLVVSNVLSAAILVIYYVRQ